MPKTMSVRYLAACLFLFVLAAFVNGQKWAHPGTVHGRVANVVGLPVPHAELIFESQFEIQRTTTDAKGFYSIELGATKYHVTTEAWLGRLDYPANDSTYGKECRSYFRASHRSDFSLGENKSLEINFMLAEVDCVYDEDNVPRSDRYGALANPTDVHDIARTRYETLYYPRREFGEDFDLVIQFGDRRSIDGNVLYSPAVGYHRYCDGCLNLSFGDPFPGVIISYNNFTFYAPEARYDPKLHRLEATKGRIVVEDGSKRYELKKLEIIIGKNGVIIRSS